MRFVLFVLTLINMASAVMMGFTAAAAFKSGDTGMGVLDVGIGLLNVVVGLWALTTAVEY